MANYIGKVQIGSNGEQVLIGSTLYGVCSTSANEAAKVVELPEFNAIMHKITVQVRFVNGNSITSGITLKVGSTDPYPVIGNCVCAANDIIAFTLSQTSETTYWYANHSILVQPGSENGTISIAGQEVAVQGLGTAAYQNTDAFATAAQGQKADEAMPKSGGTFTGEVLMSESTTDSSNAHAIATKDYVLSKTAGLSGLQGAMHFRGETTATDDSGHPTVPNSTDSFNNYDAGDVLLVGNQEYVYSKGTTATASQWILLGDEGSYVLKSSQTTDTALKNASLVDGTVDAVGTTSYSIPNVIQAGTYTRIEVNTGVLEIRLGSDTTLGTAFSVNGVTDGTIQKMPTLNSTPITVVTPVTP